MIGSSITTSLFSNALNVLSVSGDLWTPSDLTVAPDTWWDASNADSITESGGLVSQWNDISGNNNHATAIVGEEPTLGTNELVWDGTNKMMSFTSRLFNSLSAYIVCSWADTTGDNRVIMGDIGSTNWHGDTAASGNLFSAAFGAATFVNGTNYINGTLTAGALSRYTQKTIHVLQPDGAVTTGQIGRDRGFASRTFKGSMKEILLFDYILTESDRQKMEGYAAWKWGTVASLPSGHPYKSSAPTV